MDEILKKFSEYAELNFDEKTNNQIFTNKNKMPRKFFYKSGFSKKPYNFIFYTNGCSWIDSKYLDDIIAEAVPDALHFNRAKSGHGNLEIVDRSIRDLFFLNELGIPICAYISFSEVCRNQDEFSLENPAHSTTLSEYFNKILHKEYEILKNNLDELEIEHYITTSFVTNSFNQNRRIVDDCVDIPYNKEIYGIFTSGLVEYIKDRNKIFKFDTRDFVNELENINDYINFLRKSHLVDDSCHPQRWECYRSVAELAINFAKKIDKKQK